MTWNAISVNSGDVLTSQTMTNMQGNFAAITNADAGAPAISVDAITSGTLLTRTIKTQLASISGIVGGASIEVTLQDYALWPSLTTSQFGSVGPAQNPVIVLTTSRSTFTNDPDTAKFSLTRNANINAATQSYFVDYRYMVN